MNTLEELRKQIDQIDAELIMCPGFRMSLVKKSEHIKNKQSFSA